MNRMYVVAGLAIAGLLLALSTIGAPFTRAADCQRTSVDLKPVTELAPDTYLGQPGGLYPGGQNSPPPAHARVATGRASDIQPRRFDGAVAPDGKIVFMSLGMTFAMLEYQTFMQLAAADPQVSPSLLLVDGAQSPGFADAATDPAGAYWTGVDGRLQAAGASRDQVQVIWMKEAVANPTGPFPEHAENLRDALEAMVHIAHNRFPNLQIMFLSSRSYGGYAESGRRNPQRLNPEPYAYESGFAVRWLIEKQIDGDLALNPDPGNGPVTAPVLLWGPYLWADGTTGRNDGLVWNCSDFMPDGTTPSASGQQKVAQMLMAFLKTDPTSKLWFMSDPEATPIPTATELPTNTPAPTNTPGGGRPTRVPPAPTPTGPTPTPAPVMSYRVKEVPTGDELWVSTNNPQVQSQLENIDPQQPLWVCGRINRNRRFEWGFRFAPQSVRVIPDPPQQARTTIRDIPSGPAAGPAAMLCIQVGTVTEQVVGPPPPRSVTPGTPPIGTRPPPTGTTPVKRIMLPILVNR